VILLERHDEAGQILAGNRVDRIAVAEELEEASEHGLVFPMSIGFFQRFDLLQVPADNNVQGRLLDAFAGCFKSRQAQFAAFQFVAFTTLCLEGLCGGNAGTQAPSLSSDVPFDI
jgi:hypothetical protein